MNTLILAGRILQQLRRDKRFFALSIVAPLIIIYLLKIFFDSIEGPFPTGRFLMPISCFIVHFLSFILCAIVLVRERTAGTLERMFINGLTRTQIIGGYILGYAGLATLQAVAVQTEVLILFDLDYSSLQIFWLFAVTWLLALVSVLLGIFVSTFARNEGQVFPFIPLIILPSVFLSGMIVDVDKLPIWAQYVGKGLPLHYANNMVQEVIKTEMDMSIIWKNGGILILYAAILMFIASRTLKDVD